MSMYDTALELATWAHAGQKRKISGDDYITHPIAVSHIAAALYDKYAVNPFVKNNVDLDTLRIVAILHDTIEDTSVTFDQLYKIFGNHIAACVKHLSKDPNGDYYSYLMNIIELGRSGTLIPVLVKAADLEHNISTWHEKGSLADKWRLARHIIHGEFCKYEITSTINKSYWSILYNKSSG